MIMTEKGKSSRGETWSHEETQVLINIWKDEFVDSQLSSTHKNSVIYETFSKLLRERGFNRSLEQCRTKVKKLRADYIRIRDQLRKTGSNGSEKDQLSWYDQLHDILGGKPVVDPVDLVESSPSPTASVMDVDSTDIPAVVIIQGEESADISNNSGATNTCAEADECGPPGPSTRNRNSGGSTNGGRLPIPGAQDRKRKNKMKNQADIEFLEYMSESKKIIQDMCKLEEKQLAEESATLKEMLQAQKDSEQRRHQAMQEQFQSTSQMLIQLMSTIAAACNPALPHPSTVPPWTTTPPAASTPGSWSRPHQYPPQPPTFQLPLNRPPQMQLPPTPHPTVQHEVHSQLLPVQMPVNPPPHPTTQHHLYSPPPSAQLLMRPTRVQLPVNPPHQQAAEGDSSTTIIRDALDIVNPL